MPIEDILSSDIVRTISVIGLWIKALGIIAIIWVIIHVVNGFLNRKKIRKLNSIMAHLDKIDKKINRIEKKIK
jgi:hypothetical protein